MSGTSTLLDPRRRFLDRRLVLSGSRHSVQVSYGPDIHRPRRAVVNRLWANADAIEQHVSRLREMERTDLFDLGTRIGWVALPSLVRERFLADLQLAQRRGRKLRISILDQDSGLGEVPWELMYLGETNPGFVSLHPWCSIVRVCPTTRRVRPLRPSLGQNEPLRVLLVYADPEVEGLPPIAAGPQIDRIRRLLAGLAWPTDVHVLEPPGDEVDPRLVATRAHLARELQTHRPHLLFVVAHGAFDEDRQQGLVYLESDDQEYDEVTASDLAALVDERTGPAVVLLESCWTAARGSSLRGQSVACALGGPGRIVVGMQFESTAASSAPFWNTLFSSLVAPSPLDDCVSEAREMVSRVAFETADWGCPVLLRSGAPAPGAARVVCEPAWQRDLLMLKERLTARDRDLVDELLRRLAAEPPSEFESLVRRIDPLFVLTAGDPDRETTPVITSPVWSTRLFAPPTAFTWTATTEGPWWVSVWIVGGDELVFRETSIPRLELGAADTDGWPRGVWIRWQVTRTPVRARYGAAVVRGAFEILEGDPTAQWRAHVERHAGDHPHRLLAAADWLLSRGLYDELLRRASRQVRWRHSPLVRFLLHRRMAEAYDAMRRDLTLRALGDPEGLWASALACRSVEGGYRAIGGSASLSGEVS